MITTKIHDTVHVQLRMNYHTNRPKFVCKSWYIASYKQAYSLCVRTYSALYLWANERATYNQARQVHYYRTYKQTSAWLYWNSSGHTNRHLPDCMGALPDIQTAWLYWRSSEQTNKHRPDCIVASACTYSRHIQKNSHTNRPMFVCMFGQIQ